MRKEKVLNMFKPGGLTSLQALTFFRKLYPTYQKIKLGYAGTLDPLAEGVLVVLVGDENKKRKDYINLDKEYIFSFIVGISTDTYDVLGKITNYKIVENLEKKALESLFFSFIGNIVQAYPPYSSKKIKGKPLFTYAKNGEIPYTEKRVRSVYTLFLKETVSVSPEYLEDIIIKKIKAVDGDFRQEEILKSWDIFFKKRNKASRFFIVSAHIECSSGTYIRALVQDIGEKFNTFATVLTITRTRVGNFSIVDSLMISRNQ